MHFTQGQPLVVFVDAFDSINWAHPITCPGGENPTYPTGGGQATCPNGGTPSGWPQTQVLVDGVPLPDTVTGSATIQGSTIVNYQGNPFPVDFYRFRLVGLAAGTHQVVARGLFPPAPYSDGATIDSAPITITVDPPPSGKTTVTLTTDISGTVTWDNVIVVGNGHTVTPSGSLVIKNSLITGLAGIQGSVTDADIEGSTFEDTGRVALTLGGGTVTILNNELRANNRLTFNASDPTVPVILDLGGSSTNTKLFQGNRVGAGIIHFGGQAWLIGGDTDAQSNIFIGPRTVLEVSAAQSVVRGNYSHHNYRGGWSQGFNFDFAGAPGDLLTEHNFIRGGSWPLQSVAGELRYNVIYGYGHTWLRSLASGTRVHHNLFAPETGGDLGQGIWAYGGETGVLIYNNTFDGGGLTGDFAGPTIQINNASRVQSLRNNLITYSRNQPNGNPGLARVTGDDSTYAYLDYNAFYSPDNSNKDNYAVNLPGLTEGTAGFAGHDVNGVNGQLASSPFAGARIVNLDDGTVVDEGAIWQRTQTVSSVLAAFRARYTPASGSQVIDAGDVQDTDSLGRRTDIGAIDRDGHDLDKLGKFGTASSDPTPPTVSMTAPTAGATLSGTAALAASASDNVGVVGVQFLVDGVAVGAEDTTAPYSLSLDTRTLSNGSHTFAARARDAAGNNQTSAGIAATVSNTTADTQAPSVSLTAPAAGATLTGTATLAASASDNVGVVGVQFLVDGVAVGAEDTTSPYALGLDTTTLTNGSHTFAARARDAAGNTQTSTGVAATVSNATTTTTASYRINAAGGAVSPFAADQYFSGGTTATSSATVATTGVTNAAPAAVYQTERYGNFTYTLPGLTAGASYTVRLHFAETYWTGVGQRVFNVSLNGVQVLTNFDILATAGGANKAVVRDFTTTANASGQIVVGYTTVVDNASAKGIEILGASTSGADTQAPTVSLTAPLAGVTLSGTTTLAASASDNVGVAGVQFLVDGVAVGAEDTTAPYALGLNTATLTNGSHTFAARARDAAGNTQTSAGVTATVSNATATAVYQVNVAGGAVSPFTADQYFSGGYVSTTTGTVDTTGVANAAPAAVYQSMRYGNFTYTLPGLTAGAAYTVRLHFAEIYWTASGQRVFNVALNGVQVLTNFDIVAAAGGARKAVVRDFTSTANASGQIVVTFTTVYDNAAASGIEILGTSTSAADTQAPTVSLTAPLAGATLSGTTALAASASDNVGVAGVQFLVDGVAVGAEDTTAPYSLSLDTKTLPNGSHTFAGRARDAAGNTQTSTAITATVSNTTADTQAPSVSLTAPAAGATVTGTTTLAASASDNVGVVGVQFLVDGVAVGAEDTTAPYALGLDTTTLTNGSHTFAARARDAAGNTQTSAGVTVTTSNTTSPPPSTSGPKLLSQAEIQAIAVNPTDWSARKSRCDSELGSAIGAGYAGWDWHDAAARFGTCYLVAKFLGDPAAASYSKKTIALMKVLARHHMYGTPDATQELLALGDGATRVFKLRMTPLAGKVVTVSLTTVSEKAFTYSGTTANLGGFYPILKISDTPGGPASYTKETDYHLSYYSTLTWLATGTHPASGAPYYVTVADQAFTTQPAGAVTVSGDTLTLATAPAANQAVFVSFLGADYEQTGNFMGGVESVKPDGPGYPMRTMNVGLAYAYDLLRQSPDLTAALRQEFYTVLNAEIDWYAQYGYERDGDLGNYFIRGRLTGTLFTAYGTDDDNPRAQDTSSTGLKTVARDLLMRTNNALAVELPGGYGPQGTYANGTTSDCLQLFDMWKRLTGEDLGAKLAWTSNVVVATIHGTKPDRTTFYDGGDWNELPATPLFPAMQAFIQYLPTHAMAPYARQLLSDGGWSVSGTMLDYKSGSTAFPLSYRAQVSGPVYARSDWGTGAVWLSFAAGPIIGDHQHRDQGHFTLQRGTDYLVINSGGYGLTETLPYHNTLGFDDRGAGNLIVYPPGQGYWGDAAAITKYVDGGGFVYSQADFTDAYVNNDGVRNAVTRAVRTLVYLRPDLVVVHDRAQTAQAAVKKYFNLNFNASTLARSGDVFSAVTGGSKVFMRALVPPNPSPTIAPLNYDGGTANVSNYQLMVSGSTADTFLHVFQVAGSTRTQMATSAYVASTDGRAQGAEVDAGSQRWVVLNAVASDALTGSLTYNLPVACPCGHVVGDLPAATPYTVSVKDGNGATIQQLQAATTAEGVLGFSTADPAAAQVTVAP